MKTTTVTLLILLTLLSLNTFAQDSPQWHLPNGVKARLGKGRISEIQYSPDGTRLAVASSIGIWLYDTSTGQEVDLFAGHIAWVNSVAFSPDGSTLATGNHDNTIRLWDAKTGAHIRTLHGHTNDVESVAFSLDGTTIASGSADDTIRLWDAKTGAHIRTLHGHSQTVYSVAFSPDGTTLASGSHDTSIRLWDAKTGATIRTIAGEDSWAVINSVVFSPDGTTFASGGLDGTIRLWDAKMGVHIRTLHGHTNEVESVAFSPDGTTLATGSWDDTIRLWDAKTGAHIRTIDGDSWAVYSVAFSPDGTTLASASRREIRLWDAKTGAHIRTIAGDSWAVYSVAFSPDATTLATGSWSGIRLWDAKTGAHIRTIDGQGTVNSIAFSLDGTTIASGSYDNTIRLWDAKTGAHIRTLHGHTSDVESVAFSPDGTTLASGSSDGTVLLWDLTPPLTTNAVVSIAPASVPSPAIGRQLTHSLKIVGGENVAGYQATVAFDTTAIRYVQSANGDFLPAGAFFVPPVVEGNRVTLASSALGGVSNGDGTLGTITFEVVEVKASALTLSEVSFVDPEGERYIPQIENGAVTEPPQLVGDVNRDGVVTIQDLVLVGSNFGKTGANRADVNGDGVVDIVDLVKVAGALGQTATAPALQREALAMLTPADVKRWLTQARGLDLTDATVQRGISVLEQLLSALTPKETALLPNYPNPFNPETWIPYHLAHAADVTLTIYNTKGVVVRRFELGHQPAGYYTARAKAAYWNGRNANGESVASGVYFYQLRAGDYSALRRMVILK